MSPYRDTAPADDTDASRLYDATGLTIEALVALGVERPVAVVVAPAVLGAVATETHWRGVGDTIGACERVAADLTRRARCAR